MKICRRETVETGCLKNRGKIKTQKLKTLKPESLQKYET
jgi:hypothetical protein